MEWLVDVTPDAHQGYWELDEFMRAELREHVARVAESPDEQLHRSPVLRGRLVYEYQSAVATDVRIVLVFDDSNRKDRRIALLAIARYSTSDNAAK